MEKYPEYDKNVCFIWFSLLGRPAYTVSQILLSEFGSYENIWVSTMNGAESPELKKNYPKVAEKMKDMSLRQKAHELYKKANERNIKTVTPDETNYPGLLLETDSPPVVLYYYGVLPYDRDRKMKLVSVVGSRNSSSYGRMMTHKISSELAGYGIGIVSGMALGIDTEAHSGALDANGYTVAVLANSVDYIYPRDNRYLYEKIISSGGCVLSELFPGTVPEKRFFPARNRIIGGMSEITLMMEGRKSSGAMITVDRALAYNRTVMSLPGNISSPVSEGCNYLIKSGASVLLSADDVLEELNILKDTSIAGNPGWLMGLDPVQALAAKAIYAGAVTVDEISEATGKPVKEIISAVTMLEIKGVVAVNRDGGYYIKI